MLTWRPNTEISLSHPGSCAQAASSRGVMAPVPSCSLPWMYPWGGSIDLLDVRAERAQTVHEVLIAALDPFYIMDLAGAIGGEGGQYEGRARAEVGAIDGARAQPGRSGHHTAMGVAEHDVRPHRHQFVGEEHAAFIHPIMNQGG